MKRYIVGEGRTIYRARDHSWRTKFGRENNEFSVNK